MEIGKTGTVMAEKNKLKRNKKEKSNEKKMKIKAII